MKLDIKKIEEELKLMMERLIANLRAAASLFMTADPRAARLLAEEKRVLRDAEAAAMRAQFERPRSEGVKELPDDTEVVPPVPVTDRCSRASSYTSSNCR